MMQMDYEFSPIFTGVFNNLGIGGMMGKTLLGVSPLSQIGYPLNGLAGIRGGRKFPCRNLSCLSLSVCSSEKRFKQKGVTPTKGEKFSTVIQRGGEKNSQRRRRGVLHQIKRSII